MPPTGPRAGARGQSSRVTRGGGISKRRGGNAVRIDRDGDVSMDAPVTRSGNGMSRIGTGSGGRAPRGGRGNSQAPLRASAARDAAGLHKLTKYVSDRGPGGPLSKAYFNPNNKTLKVLGLRNSKAAGNSDGGLTSLLQFLERKASKGKQIIIIKHVLDGDYLWILVKKDNVEDLLRLNGYSYAGSTLAINETTESWPGGRARGGGKESAAAATTRDNLKAVITNRYNAEQKLLDLSALGTDAILVSMGTFSQGHTAVKAVQALLVLAGSLYDSPQQKENAIQAVTLANNGITDVDQIRTLSDALPRLRRLDLSGNLLDNLVKMERFRHRFPILEELHISGNPLEQAGPADMQELLAWFPSLTNLNGRVVRTPEQVVQALKALMPLPIPEQPSSYGDDTAIPFLNGFFPMFDSDRARLARELYDEDSWFSISTIANSGHSLNWKSYMKFSRNVQKLGQHPSRQAALEQRLFTGGSLIAQLWQSLPGTRHLNAGDPAHWIVDAHAFPHLSDPVSRNLAAGLCINVQGQFEEADPTTKEYGVRTFTRVFILGPPKPNSQHAFRVLSDQLTLHKWQPLPATRSRNAFGASQAAAAAPVAQPVTTNPTPGPDEQTKMAMIQQLSSLTNMTAQYAQLCLEGAANWNYELAIQSFEQLKGTLPAEAWLPVA